MVVFLIALLALIFGVAIGYVTSAFTALKELSVLQEEVENLWDNTQELINLGDEVIQDYRKVIQNTYSSLVILRDNGVEDLDEVIGVLGNSLKED